MCSDASMPEGTVASRSSPVRWSSQCPAEGNRRVQLLAPTGCDEVPAPPEPAAGAR